jgi:hypothetical protein
VTGRGLVGAATLAVVHAAGCAAPPLGLGAGGRIPAPVGRGVIEGRTSLGLGPGRQTYQAEASGNARFARWLAGEGGVVFTRLSQATDDGGELTLVGGFPFLRPRLLFGGASIAVGLSGFGFGGGGGIIGGIADLQLGYGTEAWGVHAGAYRHYFELTAEDAVRASTTSYRAGAQHTVRVGRSRVGLAVELHRQRDDLRNDPLARSSRFWGAALELSYTSPAFR